MSKTLQDTIVFPLSAEESVKNDTAKITAQVVGLKPSTTSEDVVKQSIHDVLSKFIPSATWQFSNVKRQSHASGMEEIIVEATTRVSQAENQALDRRRQAASQEGIKIHHHTVDLSPPTSMIEKTQSNLRLAILQKAASECDALNKSLSTHYRVGKVNFVTDHHKQNANIGNFYTASAMAAGAGPAEIEPTVKITMDAVVTLSQHPPKAD